MFTIKKIRNTLLIIGILALLSSCGENNDKKSHIELAEDLALNLQIK